MSLRWSSSKACQPSEWFLDGEDGVSEWAAGRRDPGRGYSEVERAEKTPKHAPSTHQARARQARAREEGPRTRLGNRAPAVGFRLVCAPCRSGPLRGRYSPRPGASVSDEVAAMTPNHIQKADGGESPAIRMRPQPRPTLLAFDITGKISKADIERMARQVEQAFDAHGHIDILLLMRDFEGMDAGAVFDREAAAAQVRSVRHVRKYGVVGAPGWARTMIELSDFLSPVHAKTFDLTQEDAAWDWINADADL